MLGDQVGIEIIDSCDVGEGGPIVLLHLHFVDVFKGPSIGAEGVHELYELVHHLRMFLLSMQSQFKSSFLLREPLRSKFEDVLVKREIFNHDCAQPVAPVANIVVRREKTAAESLKHFYEVSVVLQLFNLQLK